MLDLANGFSLRIANTRGISLFLRESVYLLTSSHLNHLPHSSIIADWAVVSGAISCSLSPTKQNALAFCGTASPPNPRPTLPVSRSASPPKLESSASRTPEGRIPLTPVWYTCTSEGSVNRTSAVSYFAVAGNEKCDVTSALAVAVPGL